MTFFRISQRTPPTETELPRSLSQETSSSSECRAQDFPLQDRTPLSTPSLQRLSTSLQIFSKRLTTSRTLSTTLSKRLSRKIQTSSSTATAMLTSGAQRLKREDCSTSRPHLMLSLALRLPRTSHCLKSTAFTPRQSFIRELRYCSMSTARRSLSRQTR